MEKVLESDMKAVIIKAKECSGEPIKLEIQEAYIVKKISGILHFTAQELKPAFDVLSASGCETLKCLEEYAEKNFRNDVSTWITARLRTLYSFVDENTVILPTCLEQFDEIVKRLVVGLLYAIRPKLPLPIIIDDATSFVLNERYSDAFVAMMRPAILTINRYLDSKEILMFNPVIIAPGGHGGLYRLARPDKYVILFDHSRWEIPRREIERLANS
jgi:hypothetical protein